MVDKKKYVYPCPDANVWINLMFASRLSLYRQRAKQKKSKIQIKRLICKNYINVWNNDLFIVMWVFEKIT